MYRSRTFISAFACLALLVSLIAFPAPAEARIKITIYFGRRGCEPGLGICRIDIDTRSQTQTAARQTQHPTFGEKVNKPAQAIGSASAEVRVNKLFLDLSGPFPQTAENRGGAPRSARPDVLPVDENFVLSEATSKALGFGGVTVLAGKYAIDYSKNKFGTVALNIEVRK